MLTGIEILCGENLLFCGMVGRCPRPAAAMIRDRIIFDCGEIRSEELNADGSPCITIDAAAWKTAVERMGAEYLVSRIAGNYDLLVVNAAGVSSSPLEEYHSGIYRHRIDASRIVTLRNQPPLFMGWMRKRIRISNPALVIGKTLDNIRADEGSRQWGEGKTSPRPAITNWGQFPPRYMNEYILLTKQLHRAGLSKEQSQAEAFRDVLAMYERDQSKKQTAAERAKARVAGQAGLFG